jgi:hypothetical protein
MGTEPTTRPAGIDRTSRTTAASTRTELRDGRMFTVTVLPDAEPPRGRGSRTRMHRGKVDYRKLLRQLDRQDDHNRRQRAAAHRRRRGRSEARAQSWPGCATRTETGR